MSRPAGASRNAVQAAGSISVPVGLFGSQIQTRRASVSTAAAATASRSIARPAGGTRVTTPPAAAGHRGVEAVGEVRDDDRRAVADEDLRERRDQGLRAVRRREALGRDAEPAREAVAEIGEQVLGVERGVEDLGGGGLEHAPRRLEAVLVPVQRLERVEAELRLDRVAALPGS